MNLLKAIVLIAVLIPLVLGFNAIGIAYWPILIFIFYFSACLKLDFSKLKAAAAGALAGILVSFSSAVFGLLFGKGIGELIFLILLLVFIALVISGKYRYFNNLGNLYLLCLTAIAPEETKIENLPAIVITVAATALILFFIGKFAKLNRPNRQTL
jgi:hypothetical protein